MRPYRISETLASSVGAVLMLLGGYVRPSEAASMLLHEWNVYGFFLGLMAISALADQAGIFEMLAYRAGRWARGSGLRLYLAVFAIGTGITAFLSNDATALILTPVVYALVTRLRLPVMPFMFACTFIADTASFLPPVSNPVWWTGLAGYIKYAFNDKWYFATRGEWFRDENGFSTGTPQNLGEFTATLQRTIAGKIMSRLEFRRDMSSVGVFPYRTGLFKGDQNTVTVGMIYAFSSADAK